MLEVTDLRIEHQTNPIGSETHAPRLSWKIKTDEKNVLQSSYRIICAASKNDLLNESSLVWDSGLVNSDQSVHVEYNGIELKSGQRIWWQVKITTNTGQESEWSAPAFWEMGLLKKSDWKAKWIEPNLTENPETSNPSPLLRKEFEVSKEVTKATVYVTCHGLYQLQLNGKKVGDQEFTPGWTSYHKRLQYQTFDITNQIHSGKNAIGVILGDGWYRGFMGWQGKKNLYGKKSTLLCQIQLTFSDGSEQLIISDKSWKASTGAIQASEIYHGEIYDAGLEKTGWDKPNYNSSEWADVTEKEHGVQNLVASAGSPVKVIKELKPIEKIITPEGETVLDFGQNMVGRIRFNLKGKTGEKVTIYHAEVLDKEGNFYIANLRPARQKLEYTFKSDEPESYAPHFTFMGFRYIKIEGYSGEFKLEYFTGEVIHSDMEFTGDFECSDPLVNRLQQNIQWGLRGNFLDVPTDCPQRDERLGWTGDAQVFAPTACFNVNAAPFFSKWMKDLEADQREDGSVPWVVPNIIEDGGGTGWSDGFGATGWADAAIIIPWTVYQSFGDKRILENQYQSMKAWEEYMIKEAGETYLFNTGFHFGDWLSFAEYSSYIYNAPDYGFAGAHTEKDLLATAYFYYSTKLMHQIALVLGRTEDAEKYKTLLPQIKEAFKNEFITPNGRLLSNTQAAFAVSLAFGVLPEEYVATAAKQLAKNVEYFQHLTTGFLGTPVLCHALSESGRSDLAYKLLFNKKYPSWLYAVTMGATTIWERWDGIKPDGTFQDVGMNSFNHYAYGAIGNWLYQKVAGIQSSAANPGYKEIIIKPEISDRLTFAKATLNSLYGTIESGWKIENNTLKLKVTVPPNTTAKIYIPQKNNSYQVEEVGSGTYEFESKIK
ncbi:glycoside hydrolase family 78 protein [Prolixibacteraceae bacterium Z1-6]|uniref:alpha-L-rhamnosidase n=1 Tax=Draconibacterium aestuarii TaxID=2998507 RepID=A0A9X3F7V1_9BACT|nr:glycoside hydrolase family 78 protein [Prolixibacteraceae bacterium Z1-6]